MCFDQYLLYVLSLMLPIGTDVLYCSERVVDYNDTRKPQTERSDYHTFSLTVVDSSV